MGPLEYNKQTTNFPLLRLTGKLLELILTSPTKFDLKKIVQVTSQEPANLSVANKVYKILIRSTGQADYVCGDISTEIVEFFS